MPSYGPFVGVLPAKSHDWEGRVESEPLEERVVLGPRPAAKVEVGLGPAGDDDTARIDAVELLQIFAHRLVLDDVEVEVRRDDALADRVIPARDVPDDRDAEPSSGDEKRHRGVRLEIGDEEQLALGPHPLGEHSRHIAPGGEVPARHQRLEDPPARQRPDAVGIEEEVPMTRAPAPLVEAVAHAVPYGEGIEADPAIELDVDPPHHPVPERDPDRKQLLPGELRQPLDPVEPRLDVLRVDEEDGGETVGERLAERIDDAAVEEDAVRERIDEEEPDPSLPAACSLAGPPVAG